MSETPSKMLALGTKAPDFKLLDTLSNTEVSLEEIKSNKGTVIIFICNHCPYVKLILKKIISVANEYQAKGFSFVAINSNDTNKYPDDSPENMRTMAINYKFNFPYLFDESQNIAKTYHAACTPDFYLFDKNLLCVYRGRFDEATPGNNKPVTGNDLINALNAIHENQQIDQNQIPSVGCNIKWKPN
ncbi:thioredoxin family protein [Gammaproteobacteria bacterium]|nr:thioredoxin family protein [Gammaproteobacteria bacterium]